MNFLGTFDEEIQLLKKIRDFIHHFLYKSYFFALIHLEILDFSFTPLPRFEDNNSPPSLSITCENNRVHSGYSLLFNTTVRTHKSIYISNLNYFKLLVPSSTFDYPPFWVYFNPNFRDNILVSI